MLLVMGGSLKSSEVLHYSRKLMEEISFSLTAGLQLQR